MARVISSQVALAVGLRSWTHEEILPRSCSSIPSQTMWELVGECLENRNVLDNGVV